MIHEAEVAGVYWSVYLGHEFHGAVKDPISHTFPSRSFSFTPDGVNNLETLAPFIHEVPQQFRRVLKVGVH